MRSTIDVPTMFLNVFNETSTFHVGILKIQSNLNKKKINFTSFRKNLRLKYLSL